MRLALACILLGVVHAADQGDVKNRPVAKVITLLKDMITQLQKEAAEDEDVYEALGCWCETNDREKTKAIADNTQRISTAQAAIEEYTGMSAQLNTETANLQKEVSKNQHALDTATALRQKQLKEFTEEEKDMIQSISALKSAVVVLGKPGAASAMLQDATAAANIGVLIQHSLRAHKALLEEVIHPAQKRMALAFAKDPEGFLQASEPNTDAVFGVISQMKETFETNLANSQKEETENQKAYEDVKAAKTDEITAGQSILDTKTQELAVADEKKAQNKQDLEDAQNTLAADQTFLAGLKQTCAQIDAEYAERTKARQAEIQATSKALEFLSSDEAHDLFSRSLGATFLQLRSGLLSSDAHRAKVVAILRSAASRSKDSRMQALEVRARVGNFDKVKASIEGMMNNLMKEKEDEIKHRDFCIDEFNKNERSIENKEREKSEKLAKIDDLQSTVDTCTKEIETMKASIAEMQVQMKRAGENREIENKDFQLTIADQRATQKLLGAALGILQSFYSKAALVQDKKGAALKKAAQTPMPPGFKPLKKSGAGGGVVAMIQTIIDDSKTMEAEAIRGEEDAQKEYENFVKDTNFSIKETSDAVVNKSQEKGAAEEGKIQMEVERDETLGELEQLYQENNDLHRSCDFLMKNFELRQSTRDEEIEALKQSIAMFSGASSSAML